jgi:threonine/homoserine/homoserine lactone efflux protein
MDGGTILAFWAVSILFVITPGADWAYAISAGLRHRSVVPAVGGLLAGHLVATVIVAAGVGALVARMPVVLAVITLVGAAYLLWLGASAIRSPGGVEAAEGTGSGSWLREAAKGAGTSGLNPKVFLLFLALLPAFANPADPWPVGLQMLVLGLVHVANCAVVYFAVGAGARTVLRARPAAARWVTRLSGAAMVIIGVTLIGERIIAQAS